MLSNNHYAADRFTAVVALGVDLWANAAYWATQTDILLDVQFSLDGGMTYTSLIQGQVDTVAIDVLAQSLRIEGRDLTATMIDNRTQETFANRTSSEIATIFAQRHDLTPAAGSTAVPFTIMPADVQDLRLERLLTLARDIIVTVKSWNSRQQTAFSQTVRASGKRSSGGSGTGGGRAGAPQHYVFVKPNLTMNDALKLAQQKAAELTQHERAWEATMPGDLTLNPRSTIQLVGTASDFDQTYFIDVIDRHISMAHGFVQRIRAKNTSPRTQTTTPADIVASVTG